MKKYLTFIFLIIFFSILGCGFVIPEKTSGVSINTYDSLISIQKLLIEKNYFSAIEVLKDYSFYSKQNDQQIKNILISNQEKFIGYADELTKNKDYHKSLFVLNFLNNYITNNDEIIKKINYNNSQIHNSQIVLFKGNVEHIFTHCLLADPSVALSPKNPMASSYNIDCITPNEFNKVLNQLYYNNYVLIDINTVFENDGTISEKSNFYFPKNKKPLIFSFDDVNYDSKKMNKGMVDKITLDKNNVLCTFTSKAKNKTSYDNEFITLLENFIKKHPDFSYNGARGLICLTGYDGILGYRTQKNNPQHLEEINKATKVVKKLKNLGWNFACHSYGHYHMKKISLASFKKDISKWKDEVATIIGETSIYVYPYGEWEVFDANGNISPKHQFLQDSGFNLFCGVGSAKYFEYLPAKKDNKVLFMDRTPIDGFSLKNKRKALSRFINTVSIYDYKYRPKN